MEFCYAMRHHNNKLGYNVTAWSRGVSENQTGPQLVKTFCVLCGTRMFITAFIKLHHLSLHWAKSLQPIPPHQILNIHFYFPTFVPCSILILPKFYLFTNWCTSELSWKSILKFTLKFTLTFGPGVGHLQFSKPFMCNVNILWTKKGNIKKYTTFCGGINEDGESLKK